jgi:hypothetical protein
MFGLKTPFERVSIYYPHVIQSMFSLFKTVIQVSDCKKTPLQTEFYGFVGSTTENSNRLRSYHLFSAIRSGNWGKVEIPTLTNTLFNSINSAFRPRHCHFPRAKTNCSVCSKCLIFSGSPSRNLSGLNVFTSSPQIYLSLKIPNAQYPMEVPSETNNSLISSPPREASLDMNSTTEGQMRSPLITTWGGRAISSIRRQ